MAYLSVKSVRYKKNCTSQALGGLDLRLSREDIISFWPPAEPNAQSCISKHTQQVSKETQILWQGASTPRDGSPASSFPKAEGALSGLCPCLDIPDRLWRFRIPKVHGPNFKTFVVTQAPDGAWTAQMLTTAHDFN